MSAGIYDITIEQGADFVRQITINQANGTPMDLTGYTGRAMVRKKYSSTSASATFTVTFANDRTTGVVTLSLTATQTAAIPAGESVDDVASQYVWDFELVDIAGIVIRVLKGVCYIDPEATK